MEGFNPTTGVAIKMFVDRSFGAIHQSLFLIQYSPGAKIDPHDHTFEESYLIVGGRVRATADGKTYELGPGDVIWTGVGCIHSFENAGTEPVRWIETQAPLPRPERFSGSSATGSIKFGKVPHPNLRGFVDRALLSVAWEIAGGSPRLVGTHVVRKSPSRISRRIALRNQRVL